MAVWEHTLPGRSRLERYLKGKDSVIQDNIRFYRTPIISHCAPWQWGEILPCIKDLCITLRQWAWAPHLFRDEVWEVETRTGRPEKPLDGHLQRWLVHGVVALLAHLGVNDNDEQLGAPASHSCLRNLWVKAVPRAHWI